MTKNTAATLPVAKKVKQKPYSQSKYKHTSGLFMGPTSGGGSVLLGTGETITASFSGSRNFQQGERVSLAFNGSSYLITSETSVKVAPKKSGMETAITDNIKVTPVTGSPYEGKTYPCIVGVNTDGIYDGELLNKGANEAGEAIKFRILEDPSLSAPEIAMLEDLKENTRIFVCYTKGWVCIRPAEGTPTSPCKIVSHVSDNEYNVLIYDKGLTGSPTTTTCKQLDIATGEVIPVDTFALATKVLGQWYMQVPVWQ